jgi:hypothetical protein
VRHSPDSCVLYHVPMRQRLRFLCARFQGHPFTQTELDQLWLPCSVDRTVQNIGEWRHQRKNTGPPTPAAIADLHCRRLKSLAAQQLQLGCVALQALLALGLIAALGAACLLHSRHTRWRRAAPRHRSGTQQQQQPTRPPRSAERSCSWLVYLWPPPRPIVSLMNSRPTELVVTASHSHCWREHTAANSRAHCGLSYLRQHRAATRASCHGHLAIWPGLRLATQRTSTGGCLGLGFPGWHGHHTPSRPRKQYEFHNWCSLRSTATSSLFVLWQGRSTPQCCPSARTPEPH